MAAPREGPDRSALLRRYNAASTNLVLQTDNLDALNDFDGPKKDLDFDDDSEFSLPIHHVPSNNLDTENLQRTSMDTPIGSSNIGYQLLKKMGWKDHTGLGRHGAGIIDPIRIDTNLGSLGVGKLAEDAEYTNAENVRRKALELEVERTADEIKKREVQVERDKAIKGEVAEIVKVFYCELCNKQYKMITEYETHLSSYDHNHRKRFQEMKQMERARSKKEPVKGVLDKETQRLMARAAAAQQKLGIPTETPPPPPPDNEPPPPPPTEPPPPLPPSSEPPRPAIKFGFATTKKTTPFHSHSSVPPPPPPYDPPPPPPSDPPPPPPSDPPPPPPNAPLRPAEPSQTTAPIKFSFNVTKKR